MIGWSFNLQQPLTITQVGWYDQGQDGLSRAFQVGLWTGYDTGSVQQLLGTPDGGITIPAGTGAALNGVWRVVDLPVPLMLQPGSYALSGYDTADTTDVIDYVGPLSPAEIGAAPLVTIPGLTIGEPNWNPYGFPGEQSNGFQAPEGWLLVWGMELGPMLFTDDSPTITPEPATLGLLAVGLAALVARRKRAGK